MSNNNKSEEFRVILDSESIKIFYEIKKYYNINNKTEVWRVILKRFYEDVFRKMIE